MPSYAGDIRNDLLVKSHETSYGKLVVHFQDIAGFVSGTRESSKYNIPLRLEDIPEVTKSDSAYFKITLFSDRERTSIVFEGEWIGGKIKRREQYHDWLIGRYLDVDLDFRKYLLIVSISPDPTNTSDLKVTEIELQVTPKRVEKNGLLDLF